MENSSSSTTPPLFSFGMELASVVVASDVLIDACNTIAGVNCVKTWSLGINVSDKPHCVVIAFVTPMIENLEGLEATDLVSSDVLDKEKFPFIEHLCYKAVQSFSIHRMAAKAFESVFNELNALYTQFARCRKPLIITGYSLGGSVASLFTLWLLCSINPATTKLPLCITFGAPLIGDDRLVKIISQRSIWDSCFLNVVEQLDPVPKLLASVSPSLYEPFGTYLFTSQSGCACYNDPKSVILIFKATELPCVGVRCVSMEHYEQVVGSLRKNLVVTAASDNDEWATRPQFASIAAQLEAMDISRSQQWHGNSDAGQLCRSLVENEQRVKHYAEKRKDPSKKLNEMKIAMANLEWYNKKTRYEKTGYYDSFKNPWARREYAVYEFKTQLTSYWKDIVTQAEQKPQAEGRILRTRYIGAGTNYRRMVEPLDIAEHYKQRNDLDYTANRHEHYARLEDWLDSEKVVDERNTVRKAAPNLTEDSCFWARVEQAIVWCRLMSAGGPEGKDIREKLGKFEAYVWSLIDGKTVSSDIFLGQSSFMKWWREYSAILPAIDNPQGLIWYMRNDKYINYK